ncbi:MAG TPA: hypothetical protein VMS64_39020 [Candidatus Methylomirabilis sp.]|nr:hypothetical protein [Candidatus Methylomirabilis sp.]
MDWPVMWGNEIEGAWKLWLQGIADVLGSGLLYSGIVIVVALCLGSMFVIRTIRRRSFWCAEAQREVEVEFEGRGWPGFGLSLAVRGCSVFDPPSCVQCRRRCLDSGFRRQWEPALPVHWARVRRSAMPGAPG